MSDVVIVALISAVSSIAIALIGKQRAPDNSQKIKQLEEEVNELKKKEDKKDEDNN